MSLAEQIYNYNGENIEIDTSALDVLNLSDRYGLDKNLVRSLDYVYGEKYTPEHDENAYQLKIEKEGNKVTVVAYLGRSYFGEVRIPEGVTHIADHAFENSEMISVYMPDSVVYMGQYAFAGSNVRTVRLSENIRAINRGCFAKSKLESINLEHITSIDNYAFTESNIRKVILKDEIIQIGLKAFHECAYLEVFEHPKSIKKIRSGAFVGCGRLKEFDLSSIEALEKSAFAGVGLCNIQIGGSISYIQSGTIVGDYISKIVLQDGVKKLASGCISNTSNKKIIWQVPDSATNIERNVFQAQDTVICSRKSVAAKSALIAKADIIYTDEETITKKPKVIARAKLMNANMEDLIKGLLSKIVTSEESDVNNYEIDESRTLRADMPQEVLQALFDVRVMPKYATDEDIENEKPKFKCILEHLYNIGDLAPHILSNKAIRLRETYHKITPSISELYNDGTSSVRRLMFADNKYPTITTSVIIAATKDTLRYACYDSRYTNFLSMTTNTRDLSTLFGIIAPGDLIGLNNVLSGEKYGDISVDSDKLINVNAGKKGKIRYKTVLRMNLYQALLYSSIVIRTEDNHLVLLVPGNRKVIRCASLGKSTWLNEKEDGYKTSECTIEEIDDIENTPRLIDYDKSKKNSKSKELMGRIFGVSDEEEEEYLSSYQHIIQSTKSVFKEAAEYADSMGMETEADVDAQFLLDILDTPIFEERPLEWLEEVEGKTIVPDEDRLIKTRDCDIYQYQTVKKTAIKSKLMVGGDNKIYVLNILYKGGQSLGVYITDRKITSTIKEVLKMRPSKCGSLPEIFTGNKAGMEVDSMRNYMSLASLCRSGYVAINIMKMRVYYDFAVNNANGKYYIGARIVIAGEEDRFVPLIQIGNLDIALSYVEYTNKNSSSHEIQALIGATKPMIQSLQRALGVYAVTDIRISSEAVARYKNLVAVKQLCIDGEEELDKYKPYKLGETLELALGYN